MLLRTNKKIKHVLFFILDIYILGSNPQYTDDTSPFVSAVTGHDKMKDAYEKLFLHAKSQPGSFSRQHPRVHMLQGRGIFSNLAGWGMRLLRGIFGVASNVAKHAPVIGQVANAASSVTNAARDLHKNFKEGWNNTGSGAGRSTIAENMGYAGNGADRKRQRLFY
jgi:hypothetical protein